MEDYQRMMDRFIPEKVQDLIFSGDYENFLLGWELCDHKQFIAVVLGWNITVAFNLNLRMMDDEYNEKYDRISDILQPMEPSGTSKIIKLWAINYLEEHGKDMATES